MGSTRRRFLCGDFSAARIALRPPWALHEAAFVERCTRCDACLHVCRAGILVRGSGGFPETDFIRGECTFCGDCVAACAPGALKHGALAWSLKAFIAGDCLALDRVLCRSCAEACVAGAIRFGFVAGGAALPDLSPGDCTGCGACVSACPVCAIAMHEQAALMAS
jgi:ferredoxin-type protein NapF